MRSAVSAWRRPRPLPPAPRRARAPPSPPCGAEAAAAAAAGRPRGGGARFAMEGMDVDLDAELMQKFSCLGTTDKDVLIGEFQRLLGFQLSPAGCAFFLDMTNW